ncbi:MAG: hypothetical protein WA397_01725 [Roseiarcus sp.]
MIQAIALLAHRERAAKKRLGLGGTVCGSEQFREIVEVHCYIGMVWPVGRFVDCECTAHRRIGGSASA